MKNSNLLRDTLKGYSEGELSELIGQANIDAYRKVFRKELAFPELVEAVSTYCGTKVLTEPEARSVFIDRLTPERVNQLISSILISLDQDINSISGISDKYSFLIALSNEYTSIFLSQFDISSPQSVSQVCSLRNITPLYGMYPYQINMVKKAEEIFNTSEDKRCMMHLPTGAGKTRTAMNIACQHLRQKKNGLVLWLADTSELCEQAANEFEKAWGALGDHDAKLYSFYSSSEISLGGIDSGMLVAGLQKMKACRDGQRAILYEQLRKHVSLIIFDEAHKAIAPTYAKTVQDMLDHIGTSTQLIGLSATPGRRLEEDEEDSKLANFFGRKKITMCVAGYESPIKYLVERGYLAKATFKNVVYSGSKILHADDKNNKSKFNEIVEYLSDDNARNKKLMEVIKYEYDKGSSIIVFACSVEHARSLSLLLSFNGIEAFSLDSKYDDEKSRAFKISQYRNKKIRVLINYSILTAGFDAPVTNVSIIARPTESLVQYSQMAGRAMRGIKSNGNKECTIYTVRDDIPAFNSVVSAFTHWDNLWTER